MQLTAFKSNIDEINFIFSENSLFKPGNLKFHSNFLSEVRSLVVHAVCLSWFSRDSRVTTKSDMDNLHFFSFQITHSMSHSHFDSFSARWIHRIREVLMLDSQFSALDSILSRNVFYWYRNRKSEVRNVREIFNLGDQFRYGVLFVEVVGTFWVDLSAKIFSLLLSTWLDVYCSLIRSEIQSPSFI